MFVIYGLGFTAMSTAIALLNVHAWRNRVALQLNELERVAARLEVGTWLILIAVGLLSTVVAAALPSFGPIAGWTYVLLAFVMPWYGKRARRRLTATSRRLGLDGPPGVAGADHAPADGAVFAGKASPD